MKNLPGLPVGAIGEPIAHPGYSLGAIAEQCNATCFPMQRVCSC